MYRRVEQNFLKSLEYWVKYKNEATLVGSGLGLTVFLTKIYILEKPMPYKITHVNNEIKIRYVSELTDKTNSDDYKANSDLSPESATKLEFSNIDNQEPDKAESDKQEPENQCEPTEETLKLVKKIDNYAFAGLGLLHVLKYGIYFRYGYFIFPALGVLKIYDFFNKEDQNN